MALVSRSNVLVLLASAIFVLSAVSWSYPSVYPTGTTIYQPDKTWNGYTVFPTPGEKGVVLIDMNGNEVKRWADVDGIPARLFPGGGMMAGATTRRPHQEYISLVQVDWDGNEVWRFDRTEQVETEIPEFEHYGDLRLRKIPAYFFS